MPKRIAAMSRFQRPSFLTFTGADDQTDVERMLYLAKRYPIEWGILFSPDRQGKENRYPANHRRFEHLSTGPYSTHIIGLAAHLCGGHSKAIHADPIAAATQMRTNIDFAAYRRVQINHNSPDPDII